MSFLKRLAGLVTSGKPKNTLADVKAFRAAHSITPKPVTPPKPVTSSNNTPKPGKIFKTIEIDMPIKASQAENYPNEYCWKTVLADPERADDGIVLGHHQNTETIDDNKSMTSSIKVTFENGTIEAAKQFKYGGDFIDNPDTLIIRVKCPTEPSIIGGSRKKHRTLKHRKLRKNKHTLRKKARHMSRTRN